MFWLVTVFQDEHLFCSYIRFKVNAVAALWFTLNFLAFIYINRRYRLKTVSALKIKNGIGKKE